MLAVASATIPHDAAAYNFEWKWDGVRAIAYVDRGRLRIDSRNLIDITRRYPELADLAKAVGPRRSAILDGEIVAFDEAGKPSFPLLQRRMHVDDPAAVKRLVNEVPIYYAIFDLLYVDGKSIITQPFAERRERLEALTLAGPSWQVSSSHVGEGDAMLEAARESRLEGIVAKRLDAPYEPGRRSTAWLKIKTVMRQEFVVGGWIPEAGTRDHRVGSMLLGYYDDAGVLRYAGRVGTGLNAEDHARITTLFGGVGSGKSPFADRVPAMGGAIRWLRPRTVIEVEYRRWPSNGMVQQGSYKGVREDKDARAVRKELVE